jgi:hypothetical protein
MLSENQKKVQDLIETKLIGLDRDDALLFHISVERKLLSVNLWFRLVEETLPDFMQYGTYSTDKRSGIDIESTLIKLSAFIDAFFMSGKSTLDAFAHEIRAIYGLGGHTGDLYFENLISLLQKNHNDSELNSYLSSLNIINSEWYKDLKSYRRASAHESIISIRASLDLDFLSGEWKKILLKLPLNPTERPLHYNGKNFIDTGKDIKDNLLKFLLESYNKILNDIKNNKTKIIYGSEN